MKDLGVILRLGRNSPRRVDPAASLLFVAVTPPSLALWWLSLKQ